MLLRPTLRNLLVEGLIVLQWIVLLKTGTNKIYSVSCFAALFVSSTDFTLCCRILLFPLLSAPNFLQIMFTEATGSLPGGPVWASWCWLFLCRLRIVQIGLSWIPCLCYRRCRYLMQVFLIPYFLFVFNFFCTMNVFNSTQFVKYIPLFLTTSQSSSELSTNWGIDLPCLLCWAAHLGFFISKLVFRACVHSFCLMDYAYHLLKYFVFPHLDDYIMFSSRMMTNIFSSFWLPFLGHVQCLCLPS